MRLQDYGVGKFITIQTKSALKKTLKKGLILVDGKIGSTATFIYGGERIELKPPVKLSPTKIFDSELEVIYEDEHLAVINKPAGILVSGNRLNTVVNALAKNLKKSGN